MAWHTVAKRADLPEGRGWPVRVEGRPIAVFAVGGGVYAVENLCGHIGSPIDDGAVTDGCVTCPWHGWTYDLATGEQLITVGRRAGLRTYPALIEGDHVLVELSGD
ncbi:MAG TPA: Rieske (2Fe-2S) protein [Acidimicrobiales bacterium]|jgi:nitrite reductase/ring-hydroxylating ferredoxin subunit|nr:Rieske (2Fe-2S) protein [Acidimicrobiales bacterium]